MPDLNRCFRQDGYGVRFEWGPTGAERLADGVSCLVAVDVLSFTTSVTVAVEAGTRVFPYRWRDSSAAEFAERMDARLAVGRREVTETSPWSLSPAALMRAPVAESLVLPSPNGSTIAAAAGERPVVAASLRNARAVGSWLVSHGYGTVERPAGVIASGERWPDGSLRPAVEDLLGAAAVLAELRKRGRALSPEAVVAEAAHAGTRDVTATVAASASGRELAGGGFAEDVDVATELDVSTVVPVLADGCFTAVRGG